MIRPLTLEDLPLCEPIAKAFFEEMELPGSFCMASFLRNWTFFLTTPGYTSVILGLFHEDTLVGGLGALMAEDLHTGLPTANEFFWFVSMSERNGFGSIRLVKEFERWGDAHGATDYRLVHMLGPKGARFESLYEKMKYRPVEVSYLKKAE